MTAAARSPGIVRALCSATGALLFLSFGYTEMAGSDMWWHLAAGRELLQTRTLWMVDHWSWTAQGEAWLNHEWLADLIYYFWASTWGVESLVYWKWLVIVATFAVLQQVLTRESGSALAGLLCAAMAAAVAAPFLDVRPHLYSLLNFSLLLLLVQRRAPIPLLAILFLVWVNLHGGFFFGLMAVAILRFPWRDPGPQALRHAVATGAVCLLACLINPAGVKAFLYPLAYAFDGDSPYRQLGEWLSPFSAGGIRSPLFFVCMWLPLLALAWMLPRVRRAAAIPWEGIFLTGLTLAMALTSRRFIPLFGISLAVMLAPLLGAGLRAVRVEKWGAAVALAALFWVCYRLLPLPLGSGPAFHYLTAEYSYPEDTLNFLEANGIGGRVYALYNWGGFLHWRSDGRLQVFIDGRADTVFDATTYNQYVWVLASRPGWIGQLEASDADYVLWSHVRGSGSLKLRELLATGRWRLLYQDSVSWLLVRSTVTLPDPLRAPPDTPVRDITLARTSAMAGNLDRAIDRAERARRAVPWHRQACNLLTALYRQRRETIRADQILAECRGYFPSALLR